MDGRWKYYWQDGNIKAEGDFIQGNGGNINKLTKIPMNGRDGEWKSWYQNGSKWCVINFSKGKKHGSQVNWYDNGQKELEGSYNKDKPVNLWSWWYFDGAPMQEGKYNENGDFEGLYFINPSVPEFSSP